MFVVKQLADLFMITGTIGAIYFIFVYLLPLMQKDIEEYKIKDKIKKWFGERPGG
jgi:hypothetical protein